MLRTAILLLILLTAAIACIEVGDKFSGLAPGIWRAYLQLESIPFTEDPAQLSKGELVTENQLPFQFEVIYENDSDFYIEIINGEERIRVDDIYIGRNPATARDTIEIRFPLYESYIKGEFEAGMINGNWIVENRDNYLIPFVARFGQDYRFTSLVKTPKADLTGKWDATFEIETDHPFPAVGEFVQEGNRLTGTFLTEIGDYRYLEGTVQANKFYLSCFDGAHSFLFQGRIEEDNTLIGSFSNGIHYATMWQAKRNPDAKLTDPNKLTFLKDGYDRLAFSFPNTSGELVSLNDERYKGKPKIIQIFGTWCPNCRDETEFLASYIRENNVMDLEIIALAYEKRKDASKAMATIQRYKKHFNVDYELLLAGPNDKTLAAETLPMLNHILSYPTMIFLDRNDRVRRIHTGFYGPATSEFENFKKDFNESLQMILSE
ncbi:MAG: TlpA family protein disulfide reductase [Bacteroidia bacterium]|nr:TlpA family protein disulfide reductase [Bacteroidia bacterium]